MVLQPQGSNFLKLLWDISGDHHELYASSVMGGQFALFMQAVYCLYMEKNDPHRCFNRSVKFWRVFPTEDNSLRTGEVRVNAEIWWDREGAFDFFLFSRVQSECRTRSFPQKDLVYIEIRQNRHRKGPKRTYVVEGRDLCYAVAKALTDVLKKVGIHGYYRSTGDSCDDCCGDSIDFEQFLFLKAYALGAEEVRMLTQDGLDEDWDEAEASPIEKEIELLLFEM